jgi:hypothetical protein
MKRTKEKIIQLLNFSMLPVAIKCHEHNIVTLITKLFIESREMGRLGI